MYAVLYSIEALSKFKPEARPFPRLKLTYVKTDPFETARTRREKAILEVKKWVRRVLGPPFSETPLNEALYFCEIVRRGW